MEQLLSVLQMRFEQHMYRHPGISWDDVVARLAKQGKALKTLQAMEDTGGEPDVIALNQETGQVLFADCAKATPAGRRSLCYDEAALASRKLNRPAGSAMGMARDIGAPMMDDAHYLMLQAVETVDEKTSSWIATPDDMRKLGGALFGDARYGRVFFYHNGAESYYAARGFRVYLWV